MKILLIEDNRELVENISGYLGKDGIVCEKAERKEEAIDKLASFEYDIVILDLMLPDGNGLEIIEHVKKLHPETGIIILSAKNSLTDKLEGLELGADDYLPKPFHLSELNARLKAIYRRRRLEGNYNVVFNEITIDTNVQEIYINGEAIEVTKKEYEILLFFISNRNRVITKQTIAEHLWGDYMDSMDSFDFVYQHIKNLRKKMTNAGAKDYIQTVYGVGYKFKEK